MYGLIAVLTSSSCVEQIEFGPNDVSYNAISIQAKLIKGHPSTIEVTIREVFDFQDYGSFLNVNEAYLEDEHEYRVKLSSNRQGFYQAEIPGDNNFFKVSFNKNYRIIIRMANGQTIISDYEEILPTPRPEKLEARKVYLEIPNANGTLEPFPVVAFFITTPAKVTGSESNSRFLWELTYTKRVTDAPEKYFLPGIELCESLPKGSEKKTCYITRTPVENNKIYNASNLSISHVEDFELWHQAPLDIFGEGFYLNAYQQSLTKTAYEYWDQVNKLAFPEGDIFEETVGRLITNFKNLDNENQEIYGFFYATEIKILRGFARPELAGYPIPICEPEYPGCIIDCTNCALAENSSDVRPVWWEE